MKEPRWISELGLVLLHDESLAEHGGSPGVRDNGLLQSALARPQNRHAYEGAADLAELAASYAFGLAKNHPFVDGNKRAAFLAMGLFLELNGHTLTATQPGAYETILALAAGVLDEPGLADWVRGHMAAKRT